MRRHILALSTLALFCARAHADSAPVWLQVTTPHFIVVTDAGEKQARHVAGQFERMQAVFHKILPGAHSDSGAPIVVIAVKNRRDFQTIEPAEYLAKGKLDLAGLFLQSNDRTYILLRLDAGGDHPYSTVYHEYTHYITRHANLPLWLNEGIAEFYQNTDIDAHDIRFGQASPGDIELLRSQSLLPLPTLFAVDHDSPYYHDEQKGTMFYSESWALTYMLYINDYRNKTSLIPNYVNALSRGQTSVTAAVSTFGDLTKLESSLSVLISHSDFSYFTLPINLPVDESSFAVTPLTTADADAFRSAVLIADNRTDDAHKLLDSVLAANPNNALAHESEGILHLRENDFDGARKEYTEAVALHSTSFLAPYYAAVLTLRYGNHDDPSIATNLEQCLKLNPDFAPANDALAGYYAATHKDLDDAVRLSVLAISLEPDNFNYRLNNASLHMERNELTSALGVLEAARPYARHPAEIAELNSRIEQVHRLQDAQTAAANAPPAGAVTISTATAGKPVTLVTPDEDPHYPDTAPAGPHRTAKGVLHNVKCTYPTILTLTVDGGPKPLSLYTNHMYKIDYFVNFHPPGGLNPCKIDGMKAVVTYTDVNDPRVAGQIVSIEVNK